MNLSYCQVEHDLNKYLNECNETEMAQEQAEQFAEDQVNNFKSPYYWADSGNMLEALCEATPRQAIKDGPTYQDQLATLIGTGQYELYGNLCEKISKESWVKYVMDLKV